MKDYGRGRMWMNMPFSRRRLQCTLTGRMCTKQMYTSPSSNDYRVQTLLLQNEQSTFRTRSLQPAYIPVTPPLQHMHTSRPPGLQVWKRS
ncbi:glycosylphosphatidylinositol transamidase [Cryptococcus neoformans]|nr:glycosylphosphatidylinositol transamidase [Cryptococcus neoformans var. grubii]OXH46366.1 glycosylphosphatidylinositol transamidase [Cryptococcus neoformans var. grubii]OXH47328.1 glycosylphosphatidylinositol transamidase [Cryptococcus neoformans var. grubii]OXH49622.1 glycosylphosphatidylinositol transamidase [Cryptococcus neoformans var. grubii]OXH66292.1 glycosylphosphatidylinositol transamidase [Cryptococcus neoformans var. grubii]